VPPRRRWWCRRRRDASVSRPWLKICLGARFVLNFLPNDSRHRKLELMVRNHISRRTPLIARASPCTCVIFLYGCTPLHSVRLPSAYVTFTVGTPTDDVSRHIPVAEKTPRVLLLQYACTKGLSRDAISKRSENDSHHLPVAVHCYNYYYYTSAGRYRRCNNIKNYAFSLTHALYSYYCSYRNS
jgi:hypothetical protein